MIIVREIKLKWTGVRFFVIVIMAIMASFLLSGECNYSAYYRGGE